MGSRLIWLAVFYAAYFGFVGLYSPFLGPYLKSIGHSLDTIALALGMMQIMRIFGPFLWGWVADHSGHQVRWLRLGSILGLAFSAVALSNAHDVFWLLPGIVLLNFSISGLVPLSDTYAMSVSSGQTGLYGRVRLFGSVGFLFAVLAFGAWADGFGFSAYPVWVWLVLFFACCAAWNFHPTSGEEEVQSVDSSGAENQGVASLFCSRDLQYFWAAAFFMIFAHGVFYSFFSLYLQEFHYSESVIGVLWAVGVGFEIMFFALQGKIYSHFGHIVWLRISFLTCFVRFALTAAVPELLWVLVLAQSGHCLTFAAHHTATIAWLRLRLPKKLWVRGQALYATLAYGLGGTAGTFIGKWFWTAVSPSFAFAVAAAAGLLAFVVSLKLDR